MAALKGSGVANEPELRYVGVVMARQPDKAILILANAVAEVVGAESRAFQHLLVAAGSEDGRDYNRARMMFDGLPRADRSAVKGKAETTANAVRQQTVLRRVLRKLPTWRPDNVEYVWPRFVANTDSATGRK
jgi:hypothetical protein